MWKGIIDIGKRVLAFTRELRQTKSDLNELLLEMQRLREQMQHDQAEIDRLKIESRAISAHTDKLLLQLKAQLDALQRMA